MLTDTIAWEETWGKLVARAWTDDSFRQQLLADPAAVLKENGVPVPAGLQVRVVEDTDTLFHLVLPAPPSTDELSEEQLSRVVGGAASTARPATPSQKCRTACRGCRGCGGCRTCSKRPHD
jgi:hypothetical protein